MLKRIITAIVAIAIFIPICIFSDYIVFPIAISALSVIGVYEFAKCVGQQKKWALVIPMYILAGLIPMSRFYLLKQSHFFMLAMISIFFMLIYSFAYVMFGKNKEKISDVTTLYALFVYVVGCFSSILCVRYMSAGKYIYLLVFLGKQYAKREFVMQLHIGAERFTSTRLREIAGPVGGFAGIGNCVHVKSLTKLLDAIDLTSYGLPKTVLFTLNPADNAVFSVLSGSYAKDGVSGLVTQGPAWWWCDHQKGMTDMLENTTAFSVLSNFIGMTTDSRSFLSFVRHDYFRRILCDWIAKKVDEGVFPNDFEVLTNLVYQLCYENAKKATGGK